VKGVIEFEVDNADNASLFFLPLQRRVRGALDLRRGGDGEMARLAVQWPEKIPGQRIVLNVENGIGMIVEPLYEAEHRATRRRIEARGESLPEEKEVFSEVDVPTWCHWLRRAAQAGLIRQTQGNGVPRVEGKPRTRFFSQEVADPRDNALKTLVAVLVAKLTPEERQAAEKVLADLG
jgi:hypothetical protein